MAKIWRNRIEAGCCGWDNFAERFEDLTGIPYKT